MFLKRLGAIVISGGLHQDLITFALWIGDWECQISVMQFWTIKLNKQCGMSMFYFRRWERTYVKLFRGLIQIYWGFP